MFNSLSAKATAVISSWDEFYPHSVIEFGNQRFDLNAMAHRWICANVGEIPFTSKTTKDWYQQLGVMNYLAIDVNEDMDAVAMDLNTNLQEEYNFTETFDLVTNNGTGEHLYNQKMVFENCHNLCRPGGLMLHILPLMPWINHSPYTYNPICFFDLAMANDYDIELVWIGERNGNHVDLLNTIGIEETFKEKKPKELTKILSKCQNEWQDNISIVVVFRKNTDDTFYTPIQNKYRPDITDDNIRNRYIRNKDLTPYRE